MISYEAAVEAVRSRCGPLAIESAQLERAVGRFLATEAAAGVDSPPFDNSAVDGYALGSGEPPFRVVADIAAGSGDSVRLGAGEAAKIYTGAPVPEGTVSIAMIEDCSVETGLVTPAASANHVRLRGEDFKSGHPIARAGDLVTPALIGLLASAGHADIDVHTFPRVALLTTGDELVQAGDELEAGQIYNSNAPALSAALSAMGIAAHIQHVQDDPLSIQRAVTELIGGSDVLITCGGVSVGGRDYLKDAFAACGVDEVFWKAAIKPGKPIWFGRAGARLVFGLPGNPVSSLVTFYLFARPAILGLMGSPAAFPEPMKAQLGSKLTKKPGRTDFMRGKLRNSGGKLKVEPAMGQASHMLLGTGHSDCLIVFPSECEELHRGAVVDVIPMRWGLM